MISWLLYSFLQNDSPYLTSPHLTNCKCYCHITVFFFFFFLLQDPRKVVDKIVENLTLAKPAFNNPVGRGVYTLWCVVGAVYLCV